MKKDEIDSNKVEKIVTFFKSVIVQVENQGGSWTDIEAVINDPEAVQEVAKIITWKASRVRFDAERAQRKQTRIFEPELIDGVMMRLVSFPRDTTRDTALQLVTHSGYREATDDEHKKFAEVHPELQWQQWSQNGKYGAYDDMLVERNAEVNICDDTYTILNNRWHDCGKSNDYYFLFICISPVFPR